MTFETYVTNELLIEQASTEWYVVRSLRKRGLLSSIDSLNTLLSAVAADTGIGASEGAAAANRLWADYQHRWAA